MKTPQIRLRIRFELNGASVECEIESRTLLSTFLRDEMGLTGTHISCEHGVCGSCTILVEERPVRSCLMLAAQVDGLRVETIESLGHLDDLSPLQEAMWKEHGLQCGFCTPGILMSIEGELRSGSSEEYICEEVLPGHVCRCTGYQNIRAAIHEYFSVRE